MERRKRPYSIHKRPAKHHRHIYYVKFRDAAGAYLKFQRSGFCSLHEIICDAGTKAARVTPTSLGVSSLLFVG
jgi:hypothetical protein